MTTIKLRRSTASEWSAANPVLAEGEPGFEKDSGKTKIGDGVKTWSQLSYFSNDTVHASTFASIFTPEKFGAKGDWNGSSGSDDTVALQAAINATQNVQGGVLYLNNSYKITDTLLVTRPLTIRGAHRHLTVIKQVTANKHGIEVVPTGAPDSSYTFSYHRGVTFKNFTLLGMKETAATSGIGLYCHGTDASMAAGGAITSTIYGGQFLNLDDVNLRGWDIAARTNRWDNGDCRRVGVEYSRVGYWQDGNANSSRIALTASHIDETAFVQGDGAGNHIDFYDVRACAQVMDVKSNGGANVRGGNFEEITGTDAYFRVEAGGKLVMIQFGSATRGALGTDIPLMRVDNGGALSGFGTIRHAGFTVSEIAITANAVVSWDGASDNLGLASSVMMSNGNDGKYAAPIWPVRQDGSVPAPSSGSNGANMRGLPLGIMARDASNVRDRLLWAFRSRGTGASKYYYADLTRVVTKEDGTSTGSPEGVVYAGQGDLYCRDDPTDAYTAAYVKTTAKNLNTGWQPFPNPPGATGPTGPSGSREDDAINAAGMLAENFSVITVGSTGQPVAGTIYGMMLGLKSGDVVSKLNVITGVAGVGTAPTMIKLGLVDSSGKVVAVTANEAANAGFTSVSGPVQLSLTSPYTVPSTGGYFVVFLQVGSFGTTQLQLGRAGIVANAFAAPLAGGIRRLGTFGGSQTDLPAVNSLLPSTSGSNINLPFWASVSA